MILRLTLLGASALVFNFSVASADKARLLDPVEVTGLRPVEADRATVAVTVLTGEDLAVRLSPNPADQLRAVPGDHAPGGVHPRDVYRVLFGARSRQAHPVASRAI